MTRTKEVDAMVRRARREIHSAPICEPGPGEFVDECHWSKTGFAVWKIATEVEGNYCTCRPALSPTALTSTDDCHK
jgi:hypothetical protein